MNKAKLLKAWYLTAFGLTGLFCFSVFIVGAYMSLQPVVEVEATAHKDLTADSSCVYYFTYEVQGKTVRSEAKDYYRTRTGCRLREDMTETVYYDPDDVTDIQRTSNTFGMVIAIFFALIGATMPLAIRKKWAEVDARSPRIGSIQA